MPEAESREKYTSAFIRSCWDFLTTKEQTDLSSMTMTMKEDINANICAFCKSDEFEYTSFERICIECGSVITLIHTDESGLTYSQQCDMDQQAYPYRRANHFQEWLIQFQGKETTIVPDEVFEKIRNQMKRQRIESTNDLNEKNIKQIMKTLRLNKYYEHIPQVLLRMNGKHPPRLTEATEEKMKIMFNEIQAPFDKAIREVAPTRKNFLSYSYVLRKFVELLELDDLIPHFPLLKSREKLTVQDKIWKHICGQMEWRFIPSV